MRKTGFRLSLVLAVGASLLGCGDDGASDGCASGEVECDGACIAEIQATLGGEQGIQARVFEGTCTASACHDADLPQAMLDLSSAAASEASLIGVNATQVPQALRVAPGDSAASYLMTKLLGTDDMAEGTARMPLGAPNGLCQARLDAVRAWVDAGAPIN